MWPSKCRSRGLKSVGRTGLNAESDQSLIYNEDPNLASMSLDDVHFGPCPFEHTVSGLLERKTSFPLLAPVGLHSDHDEGVALYWCLFANTVLSCCV